LKNRFKILFLGPRDQVLDDLFEKEDCEMNYEEGSLAGPYFDPDLIISYGYRHIIKKEVFSKFRTINVHISYLPWNRGSNPNFWSFYNHTPKGVTVHEVDKGIDTGNIIYQKQIFFTKEEDDLRKTYSRLKNEATKLIVDKWREIKEGSYTSIRQDLTTGTCHRHKNFKPLFEKMKDEWETKVKLVENMKKTDLQIIDEIENVRTKNNVNWMDLLRIAITENPKETKKILKNINSHDQQISKLFEQLSRE